MKSYSGALCKAFRQFRSSSRRLWFTTAAAVTAAIIIPPHIGIILTPSLEHRIFWVSRNPERVGRGDYVHFVDAELARRVGKPDTPDIFKRIGCDEGDLLTVDKENVFFCNGEFLGVARNYSLKGEGLQHFTFNGKIPHGFMFVMGEHKDSYDSRYFGLVDKSRVRARLHPIL